MAPSGAGGPGVLEPVSPNKSLETSRTNLKGRQRFEMQLTPASVALKETPRLGANILTPGAKITHCKKQVHPSTAQTPQAPQTPRALQIPGFDPSRYGKPKTFSETHTSSNEPLGSTASGSASIHSPAGTFSTLDDSGPTTPRLSSTLPTSEDTSFLPKIQLHPPSTRSQSPAAVDLPAKVLESDKTTEIISTSQVHLDSQVDPSSEATVSSETSGEVSTSFPATSSSSPSLRARTQGRPNSADTSNPTSDMDQSTNTPQWSGRPLSSNVPSRQETPKQKLQRLKVNELNSINRRNRRKDRDATASPATLASLRLPLAPEKEQKIASRVQHYRDVGGTAPQVDVPSQSHVSVDETPIRSVSQPSVSNSNNPHAPLRDNGHPQSTVAPSHYAQTPPRRAHQSSTEKSSDYYVPAHARRSAPKHNARWATNEEIKPEEVSEGSNAWGSIDPDDISTDSDDSVIALHHGNVRQKRARPSAETGLMGWDGKMQPPPIDWDDRPRFDNSNPDFKESFNYWTEAVVGRMTSESPDMSFEPIDSPKIKDVSYHADGIGLVSRKTTVNTGNAAYYGYSIDASEALRDSQPLTREELNRVTVLDTNDPANEQVLEETTEMVVQRWLAHNDITFDSVIKNADAVLPTPKAKKQHKPEANPNSPKVSIYIRPAVSSDLPQITSIYNWHVENGVTTAEYDTVPESDMRERFKNATSSKLPFVVAVMKVKRRSRRDHSDGAIVKREKRQPNVIVHNTNPDYSGMTQEEKIVGWACAQDFTCSDYVERISAELEVYVASEVHHKGVGKCLVDKLMDACDRGHLRQGGYDFDCAPEKSYLYNGGGGRDLHKLYFIVRTWSHPRKPTAGQGKGKAVAHGDSQVGEVDEDDYGQWLKAWLERWKFTVEGFLKQAGARNGR